MSDLLEAAVAAHGGLDRWNSVTSIDVAASITGATWSVRQGRCAQIPPLRG
jgi:hypothetical protein